MTDLATLQSLRDRVANATGPDYLLDLHIANATTDNLVVGPETEGWQKVSCPPITASIDAALAWVERVLPNSTGNMISWRQRDVGKPGWCGYWVKIVPDGERSGGACEAYAPSIALALILTALTALIEKEV